MKAAKYTLSVILLFSAAFLLTAFSDRACIYAREALSLCSRSVVPSLFPFMVISSMIVSSGCAGFIGKLIPVSRLLALPQSASCIILLGYICGFPIGAKCSSDMYLRGELSKKEAEVLISASSNAGPSFVISVIGGSFFKSTLFGLQLYLIQISASFISAIIVNRLILPRSGNTERAKKRSVSPSDFDFYSAVSQSASGMITVCAFIVFFSVLLRFILPFLSSVSPALSGLFAATVEFTQGSLTASRFGGTLGKALAGFCIGWAGLSVFCQTAVFTRPLGLSLKRYTGVKALQGAICAVACAFIPLEGAACNREIYEEAFISLPYGIPISAICLFLYLFSIKKLALEHKIKKVP